MESVSNKNESGSDIFISKSNINIKNEYKWYRQGCNRNELLAYIKDVNFDCMC